MAAVELQLQLEKMKGAQRKDRLQMTEGPPEGELQHKQLQQALKIWFSTITNKGKNSRQTTEVLEERGKWLHLQQQQI